MNITELKEKLLESVDVWADARIDDMVKANPMLPRPCCGSDPQRGRVFEIPKRPRGSLKAHPACVRNIRSVRRYLVPPEA